MYISLAKWRDLTDGHLYHEGDMYPFDGRDIPDERLEALENGKNRAGLALIRADKAGDENPEVQKEEAPEKASGGRKTAKKTTRK